MFVPEEISEEERIRLLKKKKKTITTRGRKKKKGRANAPTNNPTPNPTNPPTDGALKTTDKLKSPPVAPDFTLFTNIMNNANMTDDEKVSHEGRKPVE